ncbi:DEAD/DEAH box helicase [Rhodohalobacter sp. 8-1]|uniref:DEAD/DEAH box helicase n=1 Tax=Rhodohalobacter sp. 8-1 TaxID=3131972 RepID=UPI0030EF6B6E
MQDIQKLLDKAIRALDAEIKAVREKPSSDVLFNGTKCKAQPEDGVDYQFESHQQSIRFAEEIRALIDEKELTIHPIAYENQEVILRFPDDQGPDISEMHVEWENDFILKKTLEEIERIDSEDEAIRKRVENLFNPPEGSLADGDPVAEDGHRNEAQKDAIKKAVTNRTVFIWGPPGTGKTATLGYIIANYLDQGKSVLFASNTNRAVDVGLLSTLHALKTVGRDIPQNRLTRFGEVALSDSALEEYVFDHQMEQVVQQKKETAGEWISLLERREAALKKVEKRLRDGKQPTNNQELELKLIDQKIEDLGGRDELEAKIEAQSSVNERSELRKKQLVATTLAKVCTSDLFFDLEFDAVIVDEGSMASLPYLMVLASLSKWHMVVVGDPMQLPPISITTDREARDFLEKDIFTTVSGAETTGDLFAWHDEHPSYTAFFDTQYRLEESLADVISAVFYEGRLKTDKPPETLGLSGNNRAFHLVDTSKYNPYLEQKSGERGFKPVNLVHQEVVERLIQKLAGRGVLMQQVGVIVPFRSAVYDLRNRLYDAGIRDVEVGTIHTFQGREKDYIIFDTVMSGEKQRGSLRHYSVRPLDEDKNGLSVPRLLNVAFSRSKKELVVIADMNHVDRIYGGKFLGKLLEKIR